ncbi:MAG: hypothetical protein AB8B64_17775 [Granulosicoccus sp.]
MTSTDENWINNSNDENLTRYHRDAIDLSPSINAGQRISDLRGLADMSVPELSENCGITCQELLALEAGIMRLQPELAALLAETLGVEYSYLYVDEENQQ